MATEHELPQQQLPGAAHEAAPTKQDSTRVISLGDLAERAPAKIPEKQENIRASTVTVGDQPTHRRPHHRRRQVSHPQLGKSSFFQATDGGDARDKQHKDTMEENASKPDQETMQTHQGLSLDKKRRNSHPMPHSNSFDQNRAQHYPSTLLGSVKEGHCVIADSLNGASGDTREELPKETESRTKIKDSPESSNENQDNQAVKTNVSHEDSVSSDQSPTLVIDAPILEQESINRKENEKTIKTRNPQLPHKDQGLVVARGSNATDKQERTPADRTQRTVNAPAEKTKQIPADRVVPKAVAPCDAPEQPNMQPNMAPAETGCQCVIL